MVLSSAITAGAESKYTVSKTHNPTSSTKAWERSCNVYVGYSYYGTMVYGYNTTFINEDYVHTTSNNKYTKACLTVDNTFKKIASKYTYGNNYLGTSSIEVRARGGVHKYSIYIRDTNGKLVER